MPKYGLMAVEGPHDTEFVRALLRPLGFQRVRQMDDLDEPLRPLISKEFPAKGKDLLARHPVPLFLKSDTHQIAIQVATGDSNLVKTIADTRDFPGLEPFAGVGILLDSDSEVSAEARCREVHEEAASRGIVFPQNPGEMTDGVPRAGVYVLPDNASAGSLDGLLIECGDVVYADLMASARTHVQNAQAMGSLNAAEKRELAKPQFQQKAILSAAAAVLRPGRAIQTSIQDDRWLRGPNLTLPRVIRAQRFVCDLFEIPVPASRP